MDIFGLYSKRCVEQRQIDSSAVCRTGCENTCLVFEQIDPEPPQGPTVGVMWCLRGYRRLLYVRRATPPRLIMASFDNVAMDRLPLLSFFPPWCRLW